MLSGPRKGERPPVAGLGEIGAYRRLWADWRCVFTLRLRGPTAASSTGAVDRGSRRRTRRLVLSGPFSDGRGPCTTPPVRAARPANGPPYRATARAGTG